MRDRRLQAASGAAEQLHGGSSASQPPRGGLTRTPATSFLARSWRRPSRSGTRPGGVVARGVAQGADGALGVGIGRDRREVPAGAPQQPDHFDLVHHGHGDRRRQLRGAHLWDQVAARGRGRQRQHRVHARVDADKLQAAAEPAGRDQHGGVDRPGHQGLVAEQVPQRRWESAPSAATCRPTSPHASAASTAAPRVLDTTPTLAAQRGSSRIYPTRCSEPRLLCWAVAHLIRRSIMTSPS